MQYQDQNNVHGGVPQFHHDGQQFHHEDSPELQLHHAPKQPEPQVEEQVKRESASPSAVDSPKDFGQDLPQMVYDTPPQNVTTTRATTSSEPNKHPDTLLIPAAPSSTQEELVRRMPNLSRDSAPSDARWASSFFGGQLNVPLNNDVETSLYREGSDWRQGVTVNGESIYSTIPRFPTPNNARLEGAQAIQAAFQHMELGDIFHAAMWNSGFWVSFKPAPDSLWITINRLLGTEVMNISRETYGILHSTATSLAISTIIDSILPYVYGTSVNPNEMPLTSIPEHLSVLDEHDFIWGFIVANYPNGFNIERSCVADPSKCRHVIKELLHVREMQFVDNAALPENMKAHMRSRSIGSMSLKSVKEYQEKLHQTTDAVITLSTASGATASMKLSTPSSQRKNQQADQYIDSTREDVLRSVTSDTPASQRTTLYNEYLSATEMRLYQHWVKEITLGTNSINDPNDIAQTLGMWTRDATLRTQFFEQVQKFINNTSLSAIALEAATCPNCGQSHSREEQKLRGHIDCVPVDVVQLFSNLAEFKVQLVAAR